MTFGSSMLVCMSLATCTSCLALLTHSVNPDHRESTASVKIRQGMTDLHVQGSKEGSMWIWVGSSEGPGREVMMRGRCERRAFSRAASSISMLCWCVYRSTRGAPDAASTDWTSSALPQRSPLQLLRSVSMTGTQDGTRQSYS